MKRTLSIGSRVPPAVTRTRSPLRDGAREQRLARLQQRGGLRQATDAVFAVGRQLPLPRPDDRHPANRQELEVGLGGRVQVHAVVHRRRDQHRAGGR